MDFESFCYWDKCKLKRISVMTMGQWREFLLWPWDNEENFCYDHGTNVDFKIFCYLDQIMSDLMKNSWYIFDIIVKYQPVPLSKMKNLSFIYSVLPNSVIISSIQQEWVLGGGGHSMFVVSRWGGGGGWRGVGWRGGGSGHSMFVVIR